MSNRKNKSEANIVEKLGQVVADTHVLALKTQNYHWNVMGEGFYQLHKLFEEQYNEMFDALDEIAERIRALGAFAPGTLKEFLALSSIPEAGKGLSAAKMVVDLAKSHELMIRQLTAAREVANMIEDVGTEDILIQRIRAHEKHRWMLTSTAAKAA